MTHDMVRIVYMLPGPFLHRPNFTLRYVSLRWYSGAHALSVYLSLSAAMSAAVSVSCDEYQLKVEKMVDVMFKYVTFCHIQNKSRTVVF